MDRVPLTFPELLNITQPVYVAFELWKQKLHGPYYANEYRGFEEFEYDEELFYKEYCERLKDKTKL